MSGDNLNSVEKFFDITKPAGLLSDASDPLSWTNLSENTVDQIGEAEVTAVAEALSGDALSRQFNCLAAKDCGSGFQCVGGICIEMDAIAKEVKANLSASSYSGASLSAGNRGCVDDGDSTSADYGCATGCNSGAGCGSEGGFSCCGGTVYNCPSGPSCSPCPNRPTSCNSYCDDYLKANGESAEGCLGRECGDCSSCDSGSCVEYLPGSGPCFCQGDSDACGECETCESNGQCEEAPEGECKEECDCCVTCEGGRRFCGTTTLNASNGKTCKQACREALYKRHCEDREDCLPQKDPCQPDPCNDCEKDCDCTTHNLPCGSPPPPSPSGYSCTITGQISAEPCADTADENGWGGGGITYFMRCCKISDEESCEACDCNCENDCPYCHTCNAQGECVRDEDCFSGNLCSGTNVVDCGGYCCTEENCIDEVRYKVIDSCQPSGAGTFTFYMHEGIEPTLSHIESNVYPFETCQKTQDVCGVYGGTLEPGNPYGCGGLVGVHRDCGNGIVGGGRTGRKICNYCTGVFPDDFVNITFD